MSAKNATMIFAYVFLEKAAEKGEKNTGPCFLLNQRPDADIHACLRKKISKTNFPLSIVFNQALLVALINYQSFIRCMTMHEEKN